MYTPRLGTPGAENLTRQRSVAPEKNVSTGQRTYSQLPRKALQVADFTRKLPSSRGLGHGPLKAPKPFATVRQRSLSC